MDPKPGDPLEYFATPADFERWLRKHHAKASCIWVKYAKKKGAATIGVAANREGQLRKLTDIFIAPEVGPEVLTGSTRLKAGTAQKMVLNMLSTAAMVGMGHAYGNLLIDMEMTNQKLEGRAVRILQAASGKSVSAAEHALRSARHNMRVGLIMLRRGVDAAAARKLLAKAQQILRQAGFKDVVNGGGYRDLR